ncbi:MAG TPA: tetratricopeptide repeat protein [Taishania sp.]|nr:tetratricopeptide repeat protein [Taishania sp.]
MKKILLIALIGIISVACATKKNSNQASIHSQASFSYIEAFHKGMRLKIKGDSDAAIEAFQKCLNMRKDDDAVFYALSQLYVAKKDYQQAVSMIESANKIDPKNIWYTEQLANLNYGLKQYDKAAIYFKKLVEYEPKNIDWLYGYGDCLLKNGKVEEAISIINKAEVVLGKNPSLSIEKFNLYKSIKKDKEAIAELESILKEYPQEPQVIATLADYYFSKGNVEKGVGYLTQLVAADPENGRAHLALGEIYRKQKKVDEAFEQFLAAFKCEDVDVDTKMSLLIELQESPLSSHPKTLELVDLMVDLHPESAKSNSIKGDYLLAKGQEKEALVYYKKALDTEKSQFPIWNQVMVLEYQYLMWNDLFEDSKQCLNYFPNLPIVYLLNGTSSIELNKPNEAIDVLTTGKAFVINNKGMEAEFMAQIGEANFMLKNIKEGKKWYEDAIKLDPSSNHLKNNYANRLAIAKIDFDLAFSLINQSISNSPTISQYYDTRGWIYFQQAKYSQALEDYLKAFELESTNALYIEHLGDVYSKLNQKDKALQYWQKAVELGVEKDVLKKKIATGTYHEE